MVCDAERNRREKPKAQPNHTKIKLYLRVCRKSMQFICFRSAADWIIWIIKYTQHMSWAIHRNSIRKSFGFAFLSNTHQPFPQSVAWSLSRSMYRLSHCAMNDARAVGRELRVFSTNIIMLITALSVAQPTYINIPLFYIFHFCRVMSESCYCYFASDTISPN